MIIKEYFVLAYYNGHNWMYLNIYGYWLASEIHAITFRTKDEALMHAQQQKIHEPETLIKKITVNLNET